MFSARYSVCQRSTAIVLTLFAAQAAIGAGWSDDFNNMSVLDGNPVTWSQNLAGAFPGVYDASSGDYLLNPLDEEEGGPTDQSGTWVDTVTLGDSYVRAQGVISPGPVPEAIEGNLALLARLDPATVSSYILYLNNEGGMGLQVLLFGASIDNLAPEVTLTGITAASEVIMELNVVGDQLSGFAWLPGDPKPLTPQVTADANFYDDGSPVGLVLGPGKAGLGYDNSGTGSGGLYRFTAAQDTPFVDVPPMLDGDYNGDGTVNAADYAVWRDGGSPDDSQAGYDLWKANFGDTGVGSGAAAVPEPAGLVWILLAITGAAACVRRRK